MGNVITIYVGKAGQTNLRVGLQNGIWGLKRFENDLKEIQPGDVLLLGSGFSDGSPRVKATDWAMGSLAEIEVGVVTSPIYEDHEPVWPDERHPNVAYPHRFRFDHLHHLTDVDLGNHGPLGPTVADGLRLSAVNQGRAYVFADPDGLSLELDAHEAPPQPAPSSDELKPAAAPVSELVAEFERQVSEAGLRFPEHLAFRFLCGLLTKPFVILTGLSGSGKTQLALALGTWLGEQRMLVSPVRPDWTGAEALFGYENLLLPPSADGRAAWTVPDELHFMLRAADDPTEPYLLVLDEMNLAHVERYFADVLSGMESGTAVLPNLSIDEDGIWRQTAGGDDRIPFPPNLMVVGTVNIDETTYQFSPKVLDRSTSIEFRVDTDILAAERPVRGRIAPADTTMRRAIVERESARTSSVSAEVVKNIEDLHRILSNHGREFGHRTYQEMLRFAEVAGTARPEIDDDTIIDFLVMQKILPRIYGSARELSGVMIMLRSLAEPKTDEPAASTNGPLPLSAEKLGRMTAELDATHFTSF